MPATNPRSTNSSSKREWTFRDLIGYGGLASRHLEAPAMLKVNGECMSKAKNMHVLLLASISFALLLSNSGSAACAHHVHHSTITDIQSCPWI